MKTIIIIALVVTLAWYFTSEKKPDDFDMERAIFGHINSERQIADQDSLEWSESWHELAKEHSLWMVQNGFIHSKIGCVENIFVFSGGGSERHIAPEAINSWLGSKGHRANLMNPYLSKCGIGIAKSGEATFITYMAD